MNLIQLGLDAGILALCCEVVFRQKAEIKAKEFFIFPIFLVICVVTRMDFSNILRMTERYHGKILTRNESILNENYVVFGVLMP